jgi:hypothetical protein
MHCRTTELPTLALLVRPSGPVDASPLMQHVKTATDDRSTPSRKRGPALRPARSALTLWGLAMDELVCRDCGTTKDATEFRPRRAGCSQRTRQCRACHALTERLRRRAKRSREHRQAVNRDLARLKRAKSARQVALVCESMIQGFGGPEGFAKAWIDCLRRDMGRGSFAALRHIEATVRLIQHCEANRPDYRSMSDEELLALASRSI